MEADCIADPTLIRGDQNHSSPRAGRHYGPVKIHHPVLMGDVRGWKQDLHPFVDKVRKSLRLNSGTGDIPDVVAHEFECPLGDPSHGVAVVDDVSERA